MLKHFLICLTLAGALCAQGDPNPFAALADPAPAPRERTAKRQLAKKLRQDPLAQPVARVRATLEAVVGDLHTAARDPGLTPDERVQVEQDLERARGLNKARGGLGLVPGQPRRRAGRQGRPA